MVTVLTKSLEPIHQQWTHKENFNLRLRKKKWTYEDYINLPDNGHRYEILEGVPRSPILDIYFDELAH
ncbi:MAG TPA: hypothetical protein ENF37_04635 [Beggiatoa sp.]|nr:hypothetical protein [Beggiatoa sp.]